MFAVRLATREDDPAILSIWHEGWHDAHAALVPPALLVHRRPAAFRLWRQSSSNNFLVIADGAMVLGFAAYQGDELTKLYVARAGRGHGLSSLLMAEALDRMRAEGITMARLYCLAGNHRAARFYEQGGWQRVRSFADRLWLPDAACGDILAETHEYRRDLTADARDHSQSVDAAFRESHS